MTRFVLARLVDYSDKALKRELRRVARLVPPKDGKRILTREAFDAHARVRSQTVSDRFGDWRAALATAGLADRYSGAVITEKRRWKVSRHMTDQELLAELRELAAALGQATVTRRDVDLNGRVGSYVYFTRFGAWGEALRRAGLAETSGTRRFSDADLADNMRAVWTRLGRQTTASDMARPPSRISARTYQQRFVAFAAGKRKRYVPRAASLQIIPPHRTRSFARRRKTPVAGAGGKWHGRIADDKRGRLVPRGLRYEILERDHFRCCACGRGPASHRGLMLHVDHIVPWSKGGLTVADNLRALCAECNIGRGAGRRRRGGQDRKIPPRRARVHETISRSRRSRRTTAKKFS